MSDKNAIIYNVKTSDIPHLELKVGDMLYLKIHPDITTTVCNAQRIFKIEDDGTIRVECINKECTKKACTYLALYPHEIKNVRIDNEFKESKRVSSMSFLPT